MMSELTDEAKVGALLCTDVIAVGQAPTVAVIMLHGYAMCGSDLSPFARSLGVSAVYYIPDAPLPADPAGRCWWPMDQERRRVALMSGPRDLVSDVPAGAPVARAYLRNLVLRVRHENPGLPVALVGFSQGGMLACDTVLLGDVDVDAIALLSSSRINFEAWTARRERLRRLPVLVSHGETDADLAFSAGVALRDFCQQTGARVTWIAFQEGHVIPLVVWRGIRRLLSSLPLAVAPTAP
jgi:phospholipase/carboxylesterase